MKYTLKKDGKTLSIIDIDPTTYQVPEGMTIEPFEEKQVYSTEVAAPEIKRVSKFRFLNELHSIPQQLYLSICKDQANALGFAELANQDMTAVNEAGLNITALKTLRFLYEVLLNIDQVELESERTAAFFMAAKALGVYGTDPETIDEEIARIMRDEDPS